MFDVLDEVDIALVVLSIAFMFVFGAAGYYATRK